MLRLVDHASPTARSKLLKALCDVKMLLLSAVEMLNQNLTSEVHLAMFAAFQVEFHTECCIGGTEEQYDQTDASYSRLHTLLCGAAEGNLDSAWDVLRGVVGLCRDALLPKLKTLE